MSIIIAALLLLPLAFGLDIHNLPDTFEFNDIPVGNAVINLGPDIQIRAFKEPLDIVPDRLLPAIPIIFDTANPRDDWRQPWLGTPHEDFGGPGVGFGGELGSAYVNDKARGNVLIISANEDVFDPEPNPWGGVISIKFKIPTNIDSIGLLMSWHFKEIEVITDDGKIHHMKFAGKGANSYWLAPIKIPNAVQVGFKSDSLSAITHINFKPVEEKCPVTTKIDFSEYEKGTKLTYLPEGVSIQATKSGSTRIYPAMILDTFDPVESDFGSPHSSIFGPGKGPGGRLGMPYENIEKQGKALIVSRDQKSRNPLAARGGGKITLTFDEDVFMTSIGLLNNVQGAYIRVTSIYRNLYVNEFTTDVGGRNSFQEVFVWTPLAVKVEIEFYGAGAVTFIKYGKC